jgi:hypothetical protein
VFSLNQNQDQLPSAMGRRSILIGAGAAAAGLAYAYLHSSEPARAAAATADLPRKVSIVEFSDSGQRKTVLSLPTVIKTEDEWRNRHTITPMPIRSPLKSCTPHKKAAVLNK